MHHGKREIDVFLVVSYAIKLVNTTSWLFKIYLGTLVVGEKNALWTLTLYHKVNIDMLTLVAWGFDPLSVGY